MFIIRIRKSSNFLKFHNNDIWGLFFKQRFLYALRLPVNSTSLVFRSEGLKLCVWKATGAGRPVARRASAHAYPTVHSQADNFCRKSNRHLTQMASVRTGRSRMWWEWSISSRGAVRMCGGCRFLYKYWRNAILVRWEYVFSLPFVMQSRRKVCVWKQANSCTVTV